MITVTTRAVTMEQTRPFHNLAGYCTVVMKCLFPHFTLFARALRDKRRAVRQGCRAVDGETRNKNGVFARCLL